MPEEIVTQSRLFRHPIHSPHLILRLLCTTEQTSSSGSNETGLLTLGSVSGDSRGFTDVLMVTTTVGMVDRVHGNTTSLWPRITLHSGLVLRTGCLCKIVSPFPALEIYRHLLSIGLSVRPPPATIPIMPRAVLRTTFFAPLGSLTRVLPSSGL